MDSPRVIGTPTEPLRRFLAQWRSDDPFVEAHTSGSTGVPKLIRLPKADMLHSAMTTCRQFGLGPQSLLALPLSVDYIAGKMMVVRAVAAGCPLWIEQPSSHPLGALAARGLTADLASIVPAQIDGLLSLGPAIPVRRLLIGGAPIAPADERRVVEAGIEAYATYGMTETCSNVALRRLGTDIYEANDGFTFGVDSRGALTIESRAMSFGRLVTNDLVSLLSPGSFRWLGRADNVINSGGVKVSPELTERRMASVLDPSTFYLTGRPSERWGSEVVAVVVRGHRPTTAQLELLDGLLSVAERPKAWIEVDTLPLTSNGKLRRILP